MTWEGSFAAALGGLRRVMANELPDISCRQIVLTAELSITDAASPRRGGNSFTRTRNLN